jgi:hypothetical protein
VDGMPPDAQTGYCYNVDVTDDWPAPGLVAGTQPRVVERSRCGASGAAHRPAADRFGLLYSSRARAARTLCVTAPASRHAVSGLQLCRTGHRLSNLLSSVHGSAGAKRLPNHR